MLVTERRLRNEVMTIFVNLLDIIGLSVAGLIILLFASLFVYTEINKRIENKRMKNQKK